MSVFLWQSLFSTNIKFIPSWKCILFIYPDRNAMYLEITICFILYIKYIASKISSRHKIRYLFLSVIFLEVLMNLWWICFWTFKLDSKVCILKQNFGLMFKNCRVDTQVNWSEDNLWTVVCRCGNVWKYEILL